MPAEMYGWQRRRIEYGFECACPETTIYLPPDFDDEPLGPVDSKDSLLSANQIQGFFWEAALGVMDRLVLSDVAWERMAPLIIGRPDQKGSTGRDNRMFVEGVLWIVRTGSPWRDLPEAFGDWNSVFRRFSRWSIKGVWYRMFEAMSDDPDFEYLIIDSTIVRAHQHAAGAKKGGLKIKPSAARAAA
jgi:putative transposase